MFSSELISVPAVRTAKDELAMLYELVGPLAAVNFSPHSDPCGSRKVSWDSTCALKRSKDSVMNRTTVSKVHRHRTQSAPQRPLTLDVSEEASSVCRLWNGLCEKWMQYEDQLSRLADIETQYRTILVQLLQLLSSEKRNGFDSVHSERLFKKFDEHPSLCGDHESWGFLTTDEQKLLRSVERAFQSLVQNTDAWRRAPSPQPSLVHHPPKVVSSAVKHSDCPGWDDKNDPPTQALSRAEACIRTVPRSLLFELFRIQSTLLGNSRLPLNPKKPLTSVEEASPGTFPQPDAAWSCVNDHCFDLPARYHSTVANALHVLQRLDTTSGPSQGGGRDNDDCIGNGPSGWSLRLLRDTYEQTLEAKQQLFDARKLEGELSTAREVVHATTAQYERDTQKYLNRLHQLGQRLAAQEKVLTEGSQQVRDQCAVLNKIQREGQAALRENLRCITRHAVQAHLLQRRTGGLHRAVTEIEQCVVQRCTQLRDNVQALDRGGELLSLLHRTLRLRRRSEEKYVDGVFRKAQEALLSAHEQILEQAVRRTE